MPREASLKAVATWQKMLSLMLGSGKHQAACTTDDEIPVNRAEN